MPLSVEIPFEIPPPACRQPPFPEASAHVTSSDPLLLRPIARVPPQGSCAAPAFTPGRFRGAVSSPAARVHTPSEAYPPVGGAGESQGDALATWWHKNALCLSYLQSVKGEDRQSGLDHGTGHSASMSPPGNQ
jgi:hypothetical protein